jgi:DNA-binding SARP family transcriptional activator/TolB-like protein/tetratricopeptide (TPR) repeat protein
VLTLKTLGAVSLTRGRRRSRSETVILGPGKPLALMTYLHCAPNRTASRDRLVDLLWSDGASDAGQHNLRQTIWYIRQHLGAASVTAQRGTVTLVADMNCDRDAFLSAIESTDLERGVELYSGDFLPGAAGAGATGFEEWAGLERYRLRQLFRRAAESVVRDRLLAARFHDAQQLARRVRDTDPESETGWCLLLDALLVAGDRSVAMTEADVLEWHLAVRGREPEPMTRDVLRRVRRRSAELRTGSSPVMPNPRLVGREDQLGAILRAWDAAARGRGARVDVISAAGFGKSRLLTEARDRLAGFGALALYVAARPAARDVAHVFASEVVTALAALPGSAGISTAAAATLVALNPSLSSRFPVREDSAAGDEATRRRLFALLELVQAVSHEQPFMLLLDDLHWADSGSQQMLHGLLERVDRFPVLIVTAARPGSSAHAGTSTSNATRIHLPPLEIVAVQELLADLGGLPSASWAQNLPAHLQSIAAGSPLVLLDVLQAALDTGVVTLDSKGWRCGDPGTLLARLEALRACRVQPIESHPRSLLVVPFTSAPSEDLDLLSDGLSEDLIALLSRVGALRVISWSSARKLKGVVKDVGTLSAELNARFVLQGSVRRSERDLHISVQLTNGISGTAAWGDSCRTTVEDLSGVEQRFARSIAEVLLVPMSPTADAHSQRPSISHAGAYECYLRAKEAASRGTPEGDVRAASLLRSALKLGGENAILYATLGTVYSRYGMQMLENEWTRRRCEVCARKALVLDPESADAHFLTGLVHCRRGNLKEGVRDMLRALAINPTHTDALYWCGGWLGTLGRPETARPLAQRLLETDPLTSTNVCIPGWVEWLGGRANAAVPWYRRWVDLEPSSPVALQVTATVLIWSQRFDEARETLEILSAKAPSSPLAQFNPLIFHALAGRKASALAAVTPQLAAMAASYEITSWQMGAYHAMVGANDVAIDWLERAVGRGFINYPMLAEYDPFLKRLRGEPRFTRLLDEVKREWESLEF